MRWFRDSLFLVCLLVTVRSSKDTKRKSTDANKRAVESYSYTSSPGRYDDQSGNLKTKVIVETIKSISPSEYLTSAGLVGSTFEASTPTGKVPLGSVTFNAFEPETSKKETTSSSGSTETYSIPKKKTTYKYYIAASSTQKSTSSSLQGSSTNSPAPVRTTSEEPTTTLFPNYHISSRSSNIPGEPIDIEKSLKIITTRGKIGNGRYTLQKIIKKPTKIEPKISDSKPEETAFNGYHYDVGSLGSYDSKHSGSQGGMMGASYMRSSSPFYNYHVMLD